MNDAVKNWEQEDASNLVVKRICNAIIPAVLLALAVGQIYAFTIFSKPISEHIGESQPSVQFAFSLAIFFLGMGAAFFGKIVEKNIRLSTYIGIVLFISGMVTTGIGINLKSLLLIYAGYGFLGGLGTGVIYITPVKTLMLWFSKHKAIAAAVPIISFGLGSSVCTLINSALKGHCGITKIFFALAAIYLLPMLLSAFLLKKPAYAIAQAKLAQAAEANGKAPSFSYTKLLTNGWFLRAWLFMFLNISCGLSLIPLTKQLMESVKYQEATILVVITGCGLMNGAGRLIFAWWSDKLSQRINILLIVLAISTGIMLLSLCPIMIGLTLLVINACYGAGFSTIPAVLADHFGMDNISKIHGAVLSAWGFAGLVGNQVSLKVFAAWGLNGVVIMLAVFYALNMLNVMTLKNNARQPESK